MKKFGNLNDRSFLDIYSDGLSPIKLIKEVVYEIKAEELLVADADKATKAEVVVDKAAEEQLLVADKAKAKAKELLSKNISKQDDDTKAKVQVQVQVQEQELPNKLYKESITRLAAMGQLNNPDSFLKAHATKLQKEADELKKAIKNTPELTLTLERQIAEMEAFFEQKQYKKARFKELMGVCKTCYHVIINDVCPKCLEKERIGYEINNKEYPLEWIQKYHNYTKQLKKFQKDEDFNYWYSKRPLVIINYDKNQYKVCSKCHSIVVYKGVCEECKKKMREGANQALAEGKCGGCGRKLKEDDTYYCSVCKKENKKRKKSKKSKISKSEDRAICENIGLCSLCKEVKMPLGIYCIWCRFQHAPSVAKKRGKVFTFTFEVYRSELQKPCYYCELENILTIEGLGLDCLDPDGDYSPENAVSCCLICNMIRGRWMKPEYFKKYIAPGIRQFRLEILGPDLMQYHLFQMGNANYVARTVANPSSDSEERKRKINEEAAKVQVREKEKNEIQPVEAQIQQITSMVQHRDEKLEKLSQIETLLHELDTDELYQSILNSSPFQQRDDKIF